MLSLPRKSPSVRDKEEKEVRARGQPTNTSRFSEKGAWRARCFFFPRGLSVLDTFMLGRYPKRTFMHISISLMYKALHKKLCSKNA